MYPIVRTEALNSEVTRMVVRASEVARKIKPGQFIMLRIDEQGERIPLTMNDCDPDAGTVTIVFQKVGATTMRLATLRAGDALQDFAGPLGNPTDLSGAKRACVIGGGLGTAIAYPQAKWLHEHGCEVDVITGFRTKDLIILQDEIAAHSTRQIVMTDDGSNGNEGVVTMPLKQRIEEGANYDLVLAVGPVIMMKFVAATTKPYGIKTLVSMNPLMIDGTGMCGGCRVKVGDRYLHACVDGPDFDGHLVDYDDAMRRGVMYRSFERQALAIAEEESCAIEEHRRKEEKKIPVNRQKTKTPMPELDPEWRSHTFEEVALGYSEENAVNEARRCIDCPDAPCVKGCPVGVPIPEFIGHIARGDFAGGYAVAKAANALPAICGRVCPQETQCEGVCTRGRKGEPVAIGRLERFVADWAFDHPEEAEAALRAHNEDLAFAAKAKGEQPADVSGRRVAVVGSGPASLTCAGELAKRGCEVTMFEALHEVGGVLSYGIPEFRLPKDLVAKEVDAIQKLGVRFEVNAVIGKLFGVSELMEERGFEAVFVGAGAGLPTYLGIEGEGLNGVSVASELLTRVNLMKAYKKAYATPVYAGKHCVIVGGGNVAMDAARTARRLGADVTVVYRRSFDEMPARDEEIHHAQQEGIEFLMLTNPVRFVGSEDGWVTGVECVKMELGEPDESGRRRPIPVPGSEFTIPVDMVVVAVGSHTNPLIAQTTPGLASTGRNLIVADKETGATSVPGVFAGGDTVIGAATVILAMGAGKRAAAGIVKYLSEKA